MAPTWLPAVLPDADGADLVLPAGRILQVAADSDFLVICSQLTDETRRFISAPVFAVMKPAAAAGAHPATADPADTAHLGQR